MTLALAARFARREMRGGLRGFRLFLACLALGVAAIAAVVLDAQRLVPFEDEGRVLHEGPNDLGLVGEVAAAEGKLVVKFTEYPGAYRLKGQRGDPVVVLAEREGMGAGVHQVLQDRQAGVRELEGHAEQSPRPSAKSRHILFLR